MMHINQLVRRYKRLGLLINIVFPHLHVFGLSVQKLVWEASCFDEATPKNIDTDVMLSIFYVINQDVNMI